MHEWVRNHKEYHYDDLFILEFNHRKCQILDYHFNYWVIFQLLFK